MPAEGESPRAGTQGTEFPGSAARPGYRIFRWREIPA